MSTDYGSYNARVFMQQGATKLVCTTGGEIEFRTGSRCDQQSGSTWNLDGTVTVGGAMSFSSAGGGVIASSGARMRYQTVQVLTTKGPTTPIKNYGVTVLRPNGTAGVYRLDAPVKGVIKYINIGSSLAIIISSTDKTVSFGTTVAPRSFSIHVTGSSHVGDHGLGFTLIGASTILWALGSNPIGTSFLCGAFDITTAT